VSIEVDTIARLSQHPNICCLKAAGGSTDVVTEVLTRCDMAVLSGDDTLTLPMMAVGASGVISVLSNVVPGEVAGLCRAVLEGRFGDARAIHEATFALARDLLGLDVNPVPVKTALALLGHSGGTLRAPLVSPTPEVRRAIWNALESAGLSCVAEAAPA
jgi:4-hydroxy-tetrahydrodipicolinate synthase